MNRRCLIKQRERNRNRCQLLLLPLFTRPAAPRPAVYGFHIPVETSAPPCVWGGKATLCRRPSRRKSIAIAAKNASRKPMLRTGSAHSRAGCRRSLSGKVVGTVRRQARKAKFQASGPASSPALPRSLTQARRVSRQTGPPRGRPLDSDRPRWYTFRRMKVGIPDAFRRNHGVLRSGHRP